MPVEFAESKYIAISIFFLFQLLILGIPILVIARDDTNAYYLVMSLIIFLMSFGTTLLIFIPKVLAHRRRSGRLSSLMMSAARSIAIRESGSDNSRPIQRESIGTNTVAELQRRIALRMSDGTDNTGDLSEKNVDTSIPTEDLGKDDLDLEENGDAQAQNDIVSAMDVHQ